MSNNNICDVQLQLEAYCDGELSLSDRQALETHLESCQHCVEGYERLLHMKRLIQKSVSEPAPLGLKRRIRQSLGQVTGEQRRLTSLMTWLGLFGGGLTATLFTFWLFVNPDWVRLESQLVSAHIKSLQVDHLLDVKSSDKHTVKPWFRGKLNFSPVVYDFTSQGFQLIGGRLEYIDERNAAAIVYKRRAHIINLFIWPTREKILGKNFAMSSYRNNGFNLYHWRSNAMVYWTISDLNNQELKLFVRLLKSKLK